MATSRFSILRGTLCLGNRTSSLLTTISRGRPSLKFPSVTRLLTWAPVPMLWLKEHDWTWIMTMLLSRATTSKTPCKPRANALIKWGRNYLRKTTSNLAITKTKTPQTATNLTSTMMRKNLKARSTKGKY